MCSVLVALVLLVCLLQPAALGLQTQNVQAGQGDSKRVLGQSVKGHEVVFPIRVNSDGKTFPSNLHFRNRRQAANSEESWNSTAAYVIEAFGQKFHLNLREDEGFLAGSFVFEYSGNMGHGNVNDTLTGEYGDDTILTEPSFGAFKTENGTQYYVEPLPSEDSKDTVADENSKPHVIYKHTDLPHTQKPIESTCGVKDHHHHTLLQSEQRKSTQRNTNLKSTKSRQKRFNSYERFVETMIAVDSKMLAYHGGDLEHYVLTLMALVSSIYKDKSIGNSISITVVKLIVIDEQKDSPKISSHAPNTLNHFCQWQQEQNTADDSHPNHHDTAILLTRQDICRSTNKCDTLGLAELGTMCDPFRSCSIVEDNGLSAAFTIAHELGHVFNLPHDDDRNKCAKNNTGKLHVMAPTLTYNTNPWSWSVCSKNELTEFLNLGHGECLLDRPPSSMYVLPKAQPGTQYNVNRQCELLIGANSTVCPYMRACKRLWCTSPFSSEGCRTQHMPWADGTWCDENKWCIQGECKNKTHNSKPVNGGWDKWSPYTQCSRTCGGGVKSSERYCTNPHPKNGGKYCIGRRTKFKPCHTKPCPPGQPSFREQQCSYYDGQHFNLNNLPPNVRYVPKYSGIQIQDRCKLFCRASGTAHYHQLAKMVVDGTPCGPDTDDICVRGLCRKAGCDHVLGSSTRKDKCGICGGDDSSCKAKSDTYNKAIFGYNTVVQIPSGAKNIEVSQHGYKNQIDDDNYLALMNSNYQYIMNGNFAVSMYRRFVEVAGAVIEYSGSNTTIERINCSRKIEEDIIVQVLSVGSLNPPRIRYTYTVPIVDNAVIYVWDRYGPWKQCSKQCNGVKERVIHCVGADDRGKVEDHHCNAQSKPPALQAPCNAKCIPVWQTEITTACSVRCGTGKQHQVSVCTNSRNNNTISEEHCDLQPKPLEYVECEGSCRQTHWEYGSWSECSVTCGGGRSNRRASCLEDTGAELSDSECDISQQQIITTSCQEQKCPYWEHTDWSTCSVTCGAGERVRQLHCMYGNDYVGEIECEQATMPASKEACVLEDCPVWRYSTCSVTCGRGYKLIECCASDGTILDEEHCSPALIPTMECNRPACPDNVPTTITSQLLIRKSPRVTQWRTGSWTQCSKTCGVGSKERYVSCRDSEGKGADDRECIDSEKPPSKESCQVQPCPYWRTGEWLPCPVTCGSGITSRYVACVQENGEIAITETDCDVSQRPSSEQKCNTHQCMMISDEIVVANVFISNIKVAHTSHWRTGPWGSCSSTCDQGWKRRVVVCQDENGDISSCDESLKPTDIDVCDAGPCPTWNFGEWGTCSRSCGGGTKSRIVQCQTYNGQPLNDHGCYPVERPPDTIPCNVGECPSSTEWYRNDWSPCSATCGRGQRYRAVYCIDSEGRDLPDELCQSEKPKQSRGCRVMKCPKWKSEPWSKCSVKCGEGVKTREVKCTKDRYRTGISELCDPRKKPIDTRKCKKPDCVTYTWRTGRWSQCTRSCSGGKRHRVVHCIDSKDQLVEDRKCGKKRPRNSKKCNSQSCPGPTVIWTNGQWSECSQTCGQGHQSRRVSCKILSKGGWPVPGDTTGCEVSKKPSAVKLCNLGECDASNHWIVGMWSECSRSCGIGITQRKVQCTGRSGETRLENMCRPPAVKPESFRTCDSGPCLPGSCQDVKKMKGVTKDSEYQILVHGRLLQVYCYNMISDNPSEYLTLPAGEAENFSEIYPKTLLEPKKCPDNGNRNYDCACTVHGHPESGFSSFTKIRIDINTLSVLDDDSKFSTTKIGIFVPFGTAGDCYSYANCPQGHFNINLTGTGLAVTAETSWDTAGTAVTRNIFREKNGQIIRGRCGGYCGKCFPDRMSGLQLAFLS
uniref:A disintegrin and metalloproteinase with thrombospondin motifs 9 n=1 Tax=Saccoglossus kowalevskii TaxID=10224 RepID=A0ABM0MFP9_SACKO|nr:PREDICTED: A disintegrin and metalloproteinase with thrombospondin motifs 9 [Saccoglossus kowalevskii]